MDRTTMITAVATLLTGIAALLREIRAWRRRRWPSANLDHNLTSHVMRRK